MAKKPAKETPATEAELIVETSPVETKETVDEIVEVVEDAKPKKAAKAKAGKRSAKAEQEAEEKKAKVERKSSTDEKAEAPKEKKNPTRSKAERAGKKYREVFTLIDKTKTYSLTEALELAVKTSTTKFDSSVELHINLGVDPRQADQNIRGNLVLPAGSGKTVRIAVFAEGDLAESAKKAGADIAGTDELTQALDKEQIDFDVLISTPQQMAKLGKYARLLGPKGLMPNPKSGTVTPDVVKAVKEAKAGRVEFRVDTSGIVHVAIGKVSFGVDKLKQNADAIIGAIRTAKPSSVKGNYVKSTFVTTTMGPSIRTEN